MSKNRSKSKAASASPSKRGMGSTMPPRPRTAAAQEQVQLVNQAANKTMDARAAAQEYADAASEQASNEDESIASPIQQPVK